MLIRDVAGSVCPYCGINRPGTIDHFAPKERFPEFSVYPINLIQCCGECNTRKDEDLAENGNRLFLHAYLDTIPPQSKCLRAVIDWAGGSATFTFFLAWDPNVPLDTFCVIAEHVARLHLLEIYSEIAGEEFNQGVDWIHENDSPADIVNRVTHNLSQKRLKEGPLSWRAAVWEAVLASPESLDYLLLGTLP